MQALEQSFEGTGYVLLREVCCGAGGSGTSHAGALVTHCGIFLADWCPTMLGCHDHATLDFGPWTADSGENFLAHYCGFSTHPQHKLCVVSSALEHSMWWCIAMQAGLLPSHGTEGQRQWTERSQNNHSDTPAASMRQIGNWGKVHPLSVNPLSVETATATTATAAATLTAIPQVTATTQVHIPIATRAAAEAAVKLQQQQRRQHHQQH